MSYLTKLIICSTIKNYSDRGKHATTIKLRAKYASTKAATTPIEAKTILVENDPIAFPKIGTVANPRDKVLSNRLFIS